MSTRFGSVTRLLCAGLLLCIPGLALAGANEGGTLILHANPSLVYSSDTQSWCGQSGLTACSLAVTSVAWDPGKTIVFHALAAFPPDAQPRLKGISFGIDFDPAKFFLQARGSCADFEIADSGWPGPGTGTGQTWTASTQISQLVELYWFAGYAYSELSPDTTSFALIPHPRQPAIFVDDGMPAAVDMIADFGRLGFGAPGYSSCPDANERDTEGGEPGNPPPTGSLQPALANGDETMIVAGGNRVIVEQSGTRRDYQGGDQIHIEVRDGVGAINGLQIWPQKWQPPSNRPVSYLRDRFGTTPTVLDYVSCHHGDSSQVWNDAVRGWYAQLKELHTRIRSAYSSLRALGLSESAATDSALALALSSPLIAKAFVEQGDPEYPELRIVYRGRSDSEGLRLEEDILPPPTPLPLSSYDLQRLLGMLHDIGSGPVQHNLLIGNGDFGWCPKDKH